MVCDAVRQNTWDVLFRFIELSTGVVYFNSRIFSKWLADWKPGNFERKWMREKFLELLCDRIGPQNKPALR